jgi:hypothetical protein
VTGVKGMMGELILGEAGIGERVEVVSLWKNLGDSSRTSGVRRDCDAFRACTVEREYNVDWGGECEPWS